MSLDENSLPPAPNFAGLWQPPSVAKLPGILSVGEWSGSGA